MRDDRGRSALRHVRTLFRDGTVAGLDDGELLARFLESRDEARELAFEALVKRHGPMVLCLCRGLLRDGHAAEDAFQATFLVLALRASRIRKRGSVGPWLHGVALRVVADARAAAEARRRHEARFIEQADAQAPPGGDPEREELARLLHEELARLPEWCRAPLVLCGLDGLSHEEAARRLGWPVGTVKSRLARGKDRLRLRLVRRGVAPASGSIAVLFPGRPAPAALPDLLMRSTVRTATFAIRDATTRVAASSVTLLAQGVLKVMGVNKVRGVAVAALVMATIATGTGALLGAGLSASHGPTRAPESGWPRGADVVARPAMTLARSDGPTVPGDAEAGQDAPDVRNRARHEIDALEARLAVKRGEVAKSQAQLELAQAKAETNQILNRRQAGLVSKQEIRMAEGEVKLASAQVEVARAEAREVELQLEQVRRLQDRADRLKEYLDRLERSRSTAALEERIRRLEGKLDQALQRLEALDRGPAR